MVLATPDTSDVAFELEALETPTVKVKEGLETLPNPRAFA
jgi:hypothetical protein